MENKIIIKTTKVRINIDRIAQLVKELKPITTYNEWPDGTGMSVNASASTQTTDAHKSLILAKAWAGKLLAIIGSESPYKNDGNRTDKESIEPTAEKADVRDAKGTVYGQKNNIEKVDYLRQCIQREIDYLPVIQSSFEELPGKGFSRKVEFVKTMDWIQRHLCEAKFHLGFELQRIKEEE